MSSSSQQTLFRAMINMIALAEGGIIKLDDEEFESATNNALYGILINGNKRLTYDTELGLEIVDMKNI